MPRRKQEAPKRAAAYSPEELTEHTVEAEDAEAEDGAPAPQDDLHVNDEVAEKSTAPVKEQACDQESAGAAELSGQEVDSESHVSETSDRLSDFESTGRKTEGGMAACSQNGDAKTPPLGIDTLEQMKAIYSSFLTSPLWSPLNFSTPPQVQSSASTEKPTRSNSTSSSSSCSSGSYDWHQSAVAKTLQQQPPQSRHPVQTEHSLFSTVQLHRQNPKLFGSIFSGASKFRCKGCSAAYDTLVELTVHMNDTGHYRDDNQERAGSGGKRWSKPRKRSLLEMEGKEDAQKVLKCMYCGHSFESLQDLSVHMIKTKHYQKVPLKEPMAPVAAKIMSSKKRGLVGLDLTASPRSREGTPKNKPQADLSEVSPKTSSSPYTISNNRYGHQNGTSYAWQFESNKLQILKCMECGSSYNTLQELRTHMMVTGHFLRVTSSVGKKTQTLSEATSLNPARVTTPTEPRVQSVPLAPSTFSPPSLQTTPTSPATTPPLKEIKKEEIEEECTLPESVGTEKQVAVSVGKEEEEDTEKEEKCDISKYNYLTEEDLKESPKGGFDILKSLENTVTAAINKAQSGNPSWGGYPSIHAAYQFPGAIKLQQGNVEKTSPLKLLFNGGEGNFSSLAKNQPLISPPLSQSSPFPCNNFQAMEDLVKKVTEKVAKVEQRVKQLSPKMENRLSSCSSEAGESPKGREADSPLEWRASTPASSDRGSHRDRASPDTESKRETAVSSPLSSTLKCSTAIITGHTPPEQPFVNPLSALQSVMNIHLGKAAKPALPNQDPLSLLSRLNQSMAERAAVAGPPLQTKKSESVADNSVCQPSDDQPIDLTKGKTKRGGSNGSAPLTPSSTASSISPTSLITPTKLTVVSPYTSSSPLHENALSDISDMLRNLTQSHHVPKPPSRSRDKDEIVGSTQDEEETSLNGHKRKGRHSNWNPQHLLLLQAQFASSLRQTSDGKYIINDLSPQERMHVSRFTGLSMTTISHWLANVKYQLRRTGRTKFLKNLDSGQPMFFCSDCASQVRTPAAYVCHLEAHLGFRIKDLAKLSPKQTIRDSHTLSEKLVPLESFISPQSPDDCSSNGAVYRCQLCVRKFATKHAIKLHLSKSHGKSPEDHLLYVCEVAKH